MRPRGCRDFELPDRCLDTPSHCQPFETVIKKKLDQGLSGQHIWQHLVAEHGFTSSYNHIKRFIRRPCVRLSSAPFQEHYSIYVAVQGIIQIRDSVSHIFLYLRMESSIGYWKKSIEGNAVS